MAKKLPPGPPSGLIGWSLLRRAQRSMLDLSIELFREHGDELAFRIGPMRFYQFTHPDAVGEVLVKQAKKLVKPARFKQVFGKWDGQGLLLADGDLWVRQRRLVQTAFHPHRLRAYGDGMLERVAAHVARWRPGNIYDVAAEMGSLTLDIVSTALFGADVADQTRRVADAVAVLQEKAMRELGQLVILPDWLPIPSKLRDRREIRALNGVIQQIIDQRRQATTRRDDLLDTLLSAVDAEGDGGGMSDQQARDELMTLFLAGHETTAVSLTWALYLLAKYPQAQRRAAEELRGVFGSGPPTLDGLPRLAYLEQVVKESMRLYPAVYFTSREVAEPCEIAGYSLPRGAQIHLLPYIMHRDPRWFPEPLEFRPERFAPERESQLPDHAYWPFGAGPRACIGRGFAMQEILIVLASILSRFELSLAPGQGEPELEAQVSLHPRGGMRLRLDARSAVAGGEAGATADESVSPSPAKWERVAEQRDAG